MSVKEVAGIVLTAISIIIIVTGFVMGGGKVSGDIALLVAFTGFVLILFGPWLWLGEVPTAVRKFVEARTGRRLSEGEKK